MNTVSQEQIKQSRISWLRLAIVIVLAVIAMVLGVYKFINKEEPSGIGLIPSNASLILKIKDPVKNFLQVKQNSIWKGLWALPELSALESPFMAAKLVLKEHEDLLALSKNHVIYVSQHKLGERLGYLTVVPGKADFLQPIVQNAVRILLKRGWNLKVHVYKNQQVTEWQHAKLGKFAMTLLPNGWLASIETSIIEDAIRKSQAEDNNVGLAELDLKEANSWLSVYCNEKSFELLSRAIQMKSGIGFSGDLKLNYVKDDNGLRLKGDFISKSDGFDIYRGESVSEKTILKYVPNSTSFYFFLNLNKQSTLDSNLKLGRGFVLEREELLKNFTGSVAFTKGEVFQKGNSSELVIAEITDSDKFLGGLKSQFSDYCNRFGVEYQGYNYKLGKIYNLPIPDFANKLLGLPIKIPSNGYFCVLGKVCFFSNRYDYLDEALIQIKNSECWSGNYLCNSFNEKHNFHLVAIGDRLHEEVSNQVDSLQKPLFMSLLGNFSMVDFSLNGKNVDLVLYLNKAKSFSKIDFEEIEIIQKLGGQNKVGSKISFNKATQKQELVVVDSCKVAHIRVLGKSDDRRILLPFEPKEIPILFNNENGAKFLACYANKKIFVASILELSQAKTIVMPFATGIISFIMPISGHEILVGKSDSLPRVVNIKTGEISSYTKENWSGRVQMQPLNFQIQGEDYFSFVTLEKDVYVFNGRREILPGFPVRVDNRVSHQPVINEGGTLFSSKMSIITDYGTLVSYRLDGTLISRFQYYRPEAKTEFRFLVDPMGHSFLIESLSGKRICFYDVSGHKINDGIEINGEIPEIQYYHFGARKVILVANYVKTGRSYLYSRSLDLLADKPIISNFPIGMTYSSKSSIFTIYANSAQAYYKMTGKIIN